MLLWRIASNLLPTKDNLDKFLNSKDQCCSLCELDQESIAKWSIPDRRPFLFGQGNEIFRYRPIPVYRFGFTAIYIYIYILLNINDKTSFFH
jgi:hypothetical protein